MELNINERANELLSKGGTIEDVDNELKNLKLYGSATRYNPLLNPINYQLLPERTLKGAKEFAKGLATFGGSIVNSIAEPFRGPAKGRNERVIKAFIDSLPTTKRIATGAGIGAGLGSFVPAIGTLGGAVTGGMIGLLGGKGFVDASLSPYRTSTDDILSGKFDWRNVAQGALENPFMALMDISTPVGGKVISKTARGTSGILNKLPSGVTNYIPTSEKAKINRAITASTTSAKAYMDKFKTYTKVLENSTDADRKKIVRYIRTNDDLGLSPSDKAIAEGIRNDVLALQDEIIKQGWVDPKQAKNNLIAQYVITKAPEDNMLIHLDIMNELEKPGYIKNKNILNLIEEGKQLEKEGKLGFLSQKLVPTTDPMGNVIASTLVDSTNYFDTPRIIGRTTDKSMANRLEDVLKAQVGEVEDNIIAKRLAEDIISSAGRPYIKGEVIGSNDIRVSLKSLDKAIKKSISKPSSSNKNIIDNVIDNVNGDIVISKDVFRAMQNASRPFNKGTLFGVFDLPFKKTVLSTPRYMGMNRIGNWLNNTLEGVGLSDYLDTVQNWKLAPSQLKHQTSYGAFIGDTSGPIKKYNPLTVTGLAKPITNIQQGARLMKEGETWKGLKKIVSNALIDLPTNPIFKTESALEFVDRYANMIRQAKRYAKENKMDWKDVIKKAGEDETLYNTLNKEVNQSLGDYIGRNYFLPSGVYDTASTLMPFWRFLTQTARTTGRQMIKNPLGLQATTIAPAKAGSEIAKEIMKEYKLDDNGYFGGVPYTEYQGQPRMVSIDGMPIQGLLDTAYNILSLEEPTQGMSPLLSTLRDLGEFKVGNRYARSPGRTEFEASGGSVKNYEPTLDERQRLALHQLMMNTIPAYRMSNGWMRDWANLAGGGVSRNLYDTNLILDMFKEDPTTYPKGGPMELVGKTIGIETAPTFRKQRKNPRALRKEAMAKAMYKKKLKASIEEEKKKKRRNR